MSFKATLDAFTLLDSAKVTGGDAVAASSPAGNVTSTTTGPGPPTVKIVIPGSRQIGGATLT